MIKIKICQPDFGDELPARLLCGSPAPRDPTQLQLCRLQTVNSLIYMIKLIWINKCSDIGMEVILPALLGNYDRQTDQPTDRRVQTGS